MLRFPAPIVDALYNTRLTLYSVTDLRPKDTEDEPYYYTFKVQCTSCRETHPNWVSFNRFVCLPADPSCFYFKV